MVYYGQLVVGPPGCGKTTYCNGMSQFCTQMGRSVSVINLDFANEHITKHRQSSEDDDSKQGKYKGEEEEGRAFYDCSIDVRDLVTLENVMEEYSLGPNGGLIFCMEYLKEHIDWLLEKISALEDKYLIIDCPGQVELYSHQTVVQDIVNILQKRLDVRLCSVHLIDSFYCCEPATFISAVILIANTMLRLGLPHINVLTKVDLLPNYGTLPFSLNFYTEMTNLKPLVTYIDNPLASVEDIEKEEATMGHHVDEDDGNYTYDDYSDGDSEGGGARGVVPKRSQIRSKLAKMAFELCDILEDFGLIGFLPCNIHDATTVGRVLIDIDKANGYTFAASEALAARQREHSKSTASRNGNSGGGNGGGGGGGGGGSQAELQHLFNLASRDMESTYDRSLDIIEKYQGLN